MGYTMRYELWIAMRYLRLKKGGGFLSAIGIISIAGIAVGVAALIVSMGLMSGFGYEIKDKILTSTPHLIISSPSGLLRPEEISGELKGAAVVASAPFVMGQAIISHSNGALGVLVRGIDPAAEARVISLKRHITEGTFEPDAQGIIIGNELALRYGIGIGETVKLLSPVANKTVSFQVQGIFKSGMYDYDLNLVMLRLESARSFFGIDTSRVSGVGLRIQDPFAAEDAKGALIRRLGPGFTVRTWKDLNQTLFGALKLEKFGIFILVTLVLFVAAFNIASMLITTVVEKIKDIGVLKALGATQASIRTIFALEGLSIGVAGCALGAVLGKAVSFLMTTYLRLPPEIYYIERIPIRLEPLDVITILAAALFISFLAALYPAHKAARLDPVAALRYE